jgi:uncharacterized protein YecE (DUF72 family)
MDVRVGCSGWSYKHWAGDFYARGIPPKRWLEYYAEHFDTVEVNATFYRLQSERTVAGWAARTGPEFRFAVKVSRYITHLLRLRGTEQALGRFFRTLEPLQARIGPVLHQLPPDLPRDEALLSAYLESLPREHQHAFEFRHNSWWVEPVFDLLRRHNAMFVLYNMGQVTTPAIATSQEAYLRLHGPAAGYASGYADESLRTWASTLRDLEVERAWVYFNNDLDGHAPRNARRLTELL